MPGRRHNEKSKRLYAYLYSSERGWGIQDCVLTEFKQCYILTLEEISNLYLKRKMK